MKSALRKYTDLEYGTQKDTTANKMAATSVTTKPGVAGRMQGMIFCKESVERRK